MENETGNYSTVLGATSKIFTPLCTAPALGIMHVAPVKMIMGVDLSVQFIMKSFEKNVYSSFRSQCCTVVLNSSHDICSICWIN